MIQPRVLALGLLCLLSYLACNGQADSLIYPAKILTRVKVLADSGRYNEAIRILKRIDSRDTSYVEALYALADTYYNHEAWDSTILTTIKGLGKPSRYRAQFMVLQGMAYTQKKDYATAQQIFDAGIKEYPFYASFVLQKGLMYYYQGLFSEAEERFFEGLKLSPFNLISHQYLAIISILRGEKVKGMMAMGIYLTVNNTNNKQLVNLERFSKNELSDESTVPPSSDNPFTRLDAIVRSKLALDPAYQAQITIDASLVRQYQLVFDQLTQNSYPANNAWTKFYLPLYVNMAKANVQEPFIYHILKSSSIEQVPAWTKKNGNTLQKFYDHINAALEQWRTPKHVPQLGYTDNVQAWYYKSGRLESIGNKTGAKSVGLWHFYYENGILKAIGKFNAEGEKHGLWKYYNDAGFQTSQENYDTGEYLRFTSEGKPWQKYTIKDGLIQGEVFIYYPCGSVREHLLYNKGKRHGPGEAYTFTGVVTDRFEYKNDSLSGSYLTFYITGEKQNVSTYRSGNFHGNFTRYHKNGNISSTGVYMDGLAQGLWKNFHENGKLKEEGAYQDDKAVGEFKFYDQTGALTEIRHYDAGLLHGTNEFFEQGVRTAVLEYEANVLKESTSLTLTGEKLGEYKTENGSLTGKTFYATGEIRSEFSYQDGLATGTWKYYYRSGKLKSEYPYLQDKLDGVAVEYHPGGQVKSKMPYVAGERNGLYQSFYTNGKISNAGWYVADQAQQRWLSYNPDGTVSADDYYLDDALSGASVVYRLNGTYTAIFEHTTDGVKDIQLFNTKGELSSRTTQQGDRGLIISAQESDGHTSQRIMLDCNQRHGQQTFFFPDGKVFIDREYRQGKLSGKTLRMDAFGKLELIGHYDEGNAYGKWVWFHPNGKKETIGHFLNDERDSTWTYFYENGQISSLGDYLEDKRHGVLKLWNPSGQLLIEKKYDHGDLIAYRSPHGANQDWIPFSGQGKIQILLPNGKLGFQEEFVDGLLHGSRKIFNSDGSLYSEVQYLRGDKHGTDVTYHANGKMATKLIYVSDELEGEAQFFDSTGALIQTINYRQGFHHGPAIEYKQGKKIREILFQDGIAVK